MTLNCGRVCSSGFLLHVLSSCVSPGVISLTMKLSTGLGLKSFLAAIAVGSFALLLVEYHNSRDAWDYQALTYTDFFSFVIALVGRPIVRRYFTPDESYWKTPKEVDGLRAPIEIRRDRDGLAYLTATSREDLCFGQGFVHAAERPFQMELLRLLATGKTAAVLGASMTDTDMITRTVISEEVLLRKVRTLTQRGLDCLIAYSKGVTQAFESLPVRPIEFVLLGHTPSLPYTLLEVAAVTTIYTIMLNRGLTRDFVSVHLRETLGDKWKLFDFGYPEGIPPLNPEGSKPSLYDLSGNPVPFPFVKLDDADWAMRGPSAFPELTEGALPRNPLFGGSIHDRDPKPKINKERMQLFREDLQRAEDFDDLKHPKPWERRREPEHSNSMNLKFDGSNGWAVSGKFTKSGMPILAGDPHVEVNAPGFWLPIWMKSDGSGDGIPVRAVGASAVGATGLFVGHNEHAAWTQTVAHTDIEDLFIIDLDADGTHYFYDGKKYPLKFIEHKIHVKGRPTPVRHLSRYSHHGPIFSDVIPALRKRIGKNQALVWASVALRAPLPVSWAEKMLFGKTWKDYIEMGQHARMNEFVCVWATKDGNIGASVSGAVPLRPHSPTPQFRNGSDSTQDWKGVLPTSEVPFVMNPKSGVIVTGNSVLADDPKRIFGEVFVPGHRVLRAHQMLDELKKKKIVVEDLIKMQEDQHSIHGCEFKEFVLKEFLYVFDAKADQAIAEATCAKEGLTPYVARLLKEAMESWDCSMDSLSSGASIYEVWLQLLLQDVFKANNWTEEALFSLVGGWMHPTWLPRTEALNHWRINLLNALKNKKSGLLPAGTSLQRIMCQSASETLLYLAARLGPSLKDWQWGKLRSRFVDHVFAKEAPLLRHLLGVGPLKWGGNFGTLKAHHFEPHILRPNDPLSGSFQQGLDTTSLRVVFDLSDWKNSRWAYFPGISGWVGSNHFGDTASLLEDGKERMLPMPWDEAEFKDSIVTSMTLSPKSHNQEDVNTQQMQQQKHEF